MVWSYFFKMSPSRQIIVIIRCVMLCTKSRPSILKKGSQCDSLHFNKCCCWFPITLSYSNAAKYITTVKKKKKKNGKPETLISFVGILRKYARFFFCFFIFSMWKVWENFSSSWRYTNSSMPWCLIHPPQHGQCIVLLMFVS